MAGFLTGWMYWYFWVIVVALEAVAGAKLIQFWLPDTPAWIISLALLVVLTLTNLISVGSYGEFEFWFSSIKVGAIMVFLFLGGLYVLGSGPRRCTRRRCCRRCSATAASCRSASGR